MILDFGVSIEYGQFRDLIKNNNSTISKFFISKESEHFYNEEISKQIINQFSKKVQRAVSFNRPFPIKKIKKTKN